MIRKTFDQILVDEKVFTIEQIRTYQTEAHKSRAATYKILART